MRVPYEPSLRAAHYPLSLGQKIRDQEIRRVTRILNTPTSGRRRMTFVERYGNTPYRTGIVPAPITPTIRSRFKSLMP